MEYKRHQKKSKNTALWLALLGAVIVIAAVLISRHMTVNAPEHNTKLISAAENSQLFTPVGRLIIPKELADFCLIEDISEGNQYSMRFYGTMETDSILLFELSVGNNASGYALGSAPDTSGKQTAIWLNIHKIEKEAAWSEKEYARINELQSYVNDLIAQINQFDGFKDGV